VTAAKIIEEIKHLSAKDQVEVIRFVYHLDAERHLTGKELSALAERMTRASDPPKPLLSVMPSFVVSTAVSLRCTLISRPRTMIDRAPPHR